MRYIATYLVLSATLAVAGPAGAAHRDAGASVVDAGAVDAGWAGPQSFTAEAPPQASFGEPFPYTIRVSHVRGEVYALPREPDLGDFDLVSSDKRDQPDGANITTVIELKLRGWAVGKKAIPDLPLEVQGAGGNKLTIPGPTVDIVGTMDPDAGSSEGLRDIAAPVEVPVRSWRLLIAGAVALAVGALVYALLRWLRRPKPEVLIPAAPAEPPHVRARKALEALLAEDLPGKGRQRELYFRISEITRRYLGERFGFDALDLTTEELLAVLRKRATPGLDLTAFARECQAADLVKFAKLTPDANACKASLDAALALVAATTAAAAPRAGAA